MASQNLQMLGSQRLLPKIWGGQRLENHPRIEKDKDFLPDELFNLCLSQSLGESRFHPSSASRARFAGHISVRWFGAEQVAHKEIAHAPFAVCATHPMVAPRNHQQIKILICLNQGIGEA